MWRSRDELSVQVKKALAGLRAGSNSKLMHIKTDAHQN
jgi:hypothetical protein